ncbi:hypothetical protein GPECTOR_1g769 [Gonium pectorale]|uniref:Uncharacterized protein n=1 Tax=Gonium pectorale TaxID=33097 RepID=A0A150H476_GONPE|nr:hypothetical protein GPECTOR_1g769 [Gonium pectorale]|eukprot:KXZ56852.1 hypothetical protein GPECTOR_1g769 [Gonium pectorale]
MDPTSADQVVADAIDHDVRILFVGPEVPDKLAGTEQEHGRCFMRFVQGTFDELSSGPRHSTPVPGGGNQAPDIYLAFNPGFTCPDYDWTPTLRKITSDNAGHRGVAGRGTARSVPVPPIVVATNTRMEALMEEEMLKDSGLRSKSPAYPNPYSSLKVIQSGTLANDLYRKNAWFVEYEHVGSKGTAASAKKQRQGGRPGAKGMAKRMAQALYDTCIVPVARLIRRR